MITILCEIQKYYQHIVYFLPSHFIQLLLVFFCFLFSNLFCLIFVCYMMFLSQKRTCRRLFLVYGRIRKACILGVIHIFGVYFVESWFYLIPQEHLKHFFMQLQMRVNLSVQIFIYSCSLWFMLDLMSCWSKQPEQWGWLLQIHWVSFS